MAADPRQDLKRGAEILQPILSEAGFHFSFDHEGRSSGGPYCSGAFRKENRKLELHVRSTLGLVAYTFNDETISHEDYLYALGAQGQYPGFSDTTEGAFLHLMNDLKTAGTTFLRGSDAELMALITKNRQNPRPKGFKALGTQK